MPAASAVAGTPFSIVLAESTYLLPREDRLIIKIDRPSSQCAHANATNHFIDNPAHLKTNVAWNVLFRTECRGPLCGAGSSSFQKTTARRWWGDARGRPLT